jgi:hypothetical protein
MNMNDNQRMSVVTSLVIIGLALLFLMVEWGDGSGIRFGTRIITFYTETASGVYGAQYVKHIGLCIRNGIPGILLGMVVPLGLWAVAAYIALGSKKIGAKQ